MSLEKIEQLVEKVNHAIKTIQVLKAEKEKLLSDYNSLKAQIEKLSLENNRLKQEKAHLEKDNTENDKLHKLLEEKIEEIINALPDSDDSTIKKPNNKNQNRNIPKKAVIEKPIENNSLFAFDKEEDDVVLDNEKDEEQNSVNLKNEDSTITNFEEDIKINFEDTLIDDKEEKEINFYIDSKNNINDDLPKGVL